MAGCKPMPCGIGSSMPTPTKCRPSCGRCLPYRRWLDPLLQDASAQAETDNDRRKQLHISLALLPADASQVAYLNGRLLGAEPGEVPVIREALAPHEEALVDPLWAVAEAPAKGKESQRLRAAAALAKYDPESERWAKLQEAVANDLVSGTCRLSGGRGWNPSARTRRARDSPGRDLPSSGSPGCGAFVGDGYSGRLCCRSAARSWPIC